jgi:hypothetical protein
VRHWHLVTGEYPPGCGGVGDHTRLLARSLADAGERVSVVAPAGTAEPDIEVLATGGFHGEPLRALDARLGAGDADRVLLVQYAPQAFGRRGANLAFCGWVLRRARLGDQVRVIFHEPFVQFGWRPRRNLLAAANRLMARRLLAASARSYVSVPAWARLLLPWAPDGAPRPCWLPVGSTIPVHRDPAATAAMRHAAVRGADRPVLGHFGTYGRAITAMLEPLLVDTLAAVPESVALLVGRGAADYAAALQARHPRLAGRVHGVAASAPEEVSHAIAAMDVALQPYPDGATSRRTTLMAALAHGVAVATHLGRYSEAGWSRDLPIATGADGVAALAAGLLTDPAARASAGAAGAALYERCFAPSVAVRTLLEP